MKNWSLGGGGGVSIISREFCLKKAGLPKILCFCAYQCCCQHVIIVCLDKISDCGVVSSDRQPVFCFVSVNCELVPLCCRDGKFSTPFIHWQRLIFPTPRIPMAVHPQIINSVVEYVQIVETEYWYLYMNRSDRPNNIKICKPKYYSHLVIMENWICLKRPNEIRRLGGIFNI